MTWSQKS